VVFLERETMNQNYRVSSQKSYCATMAHNKIKEEKLQEKSLGVDCILKISEL
jgi:hypothetical protein